MTNTAMQVKQNRHYSSRVTSVTQKKPRKCLDILTITLQELKFMHYSSDELTPPSPTKKKRQAPQVLKPTQAR